MSVILQGLANIHTHGVLIVNELCANALVAAMTVAATERKGRMAAER